MRRQLGRYLKFGVSECGCAVVAADTEGLDPHQVIDAFAEHLRDVGLRPRLFFDANRLVGFISLGSGGGVAVVLAHPRGLARRASGDHLFLRL